jgi:hypothetical protein
MGDPVRLDELIEALAKLRHEHGNLKVFTMDQSDDFTEPCALARVATKSHWKPPVPIGEWWVLIG